MLFQVLVCVAALFLTAVLWKRFKYDLHKIPAPPSIPFLGHTLNIIGREGASELSRFRGTWWKRLGHPSVMRLDLAGRTFLFVRDMKFAKTVVMSNKNPFPKAKGLIGQVTSFIGNDAHVKSLLTSNTLTPYVRAIRRVYAAGFQSSQLKRAVPKIHDVMDAMVEIIHSRRKQGPIDFQELCVRMSLDAIGVVAFDCNLGGLDGSRPLYRLLIDVGHAMREVGLNPLNACRVRFCPKSSIAKRYNGTVQRLTAEWEKLKDEMMKRADPIGEEPIWYGLKRLKDPETKLPIKGNTMVAEVATLVVGGMDSTGHQLAWILALLASHPNVVESLRAELHKHGIDDCQAANRPNYESLAELTYLSAVIKEGMRIAHVFVGSFFYSVPHDMSILGYRVPKGTNVTIPSNRWMDSEAEWGDPMAFRPERWLMDPNTWKKYYLGFSYGPRDCAGQKLALLEMRLAIISLLTRFDFIPTTPIDKLLENSRLGLVIEATDGIQLRVVPRD